MSSTSSQSESNDKLMQYMSGLREKNGYEFVYINGQRVYSPPESMDIPEPPKGSEIFIGNLLEDMYEDELIPLLEGIGQLYKFRLMLDYFNKNRGFAFATYFKVSHAHEAIRILDNYEIRRNVHIKVRKSIDNCQLYIGNIAKDKTKGEIWDALNKNMEDITDITLYPDNVKETNKNRGYAFVSFKDHRSAALARRKFHPNFLMAWDRSLKVDWADPEPEVNSHVMAHVEKLIIKNLPIHFTKAELSNKIYSLVEPEDITKIFRRCNYAFVHFCSRESAEKGLYILSKEFKVQGHNIVVEYAKPSNYSKKNRLASGNFSICRSMGPTARHLLRSKTQNHNGSKMV